VNVVRTKNNPALVKYDPLPPSRMMEISLVFRQATKIVFFLQPINPNQPNWL
jgi:hypothetical protein